MLSQFASDATGRVVIAGPIEATAIGNLSMQAIALGRLESLDQARAMVRQSFVPDVFEPTHRAEWDDAYPQCEGAKGEGFKKISLRVHCVFAVQW